MEQDEDAHPHPGRRVRGDLGLRADGPRPRAIGDEAGGAVVGVAIRDAGAVVRSIRAGFAWPEWDRPGMTTSRLVSREVEGRGSRERWRCGQIRTTIACILTHHPIFASRRARMIRKILPAFVLLLLPAVAAANDITGTAKVREG